MVPPFGFMKIERIALGIFVLSGLVSLALYPFGLFDYFEIVSTDTRIAKTYFWLPGKAFLIIQGSLVVLTGPGALLRSFVIVTAGILAGLIFVTPIGALTVLPAVGMLFLTLRRPQAFWEFTPKWKGDGPPPPGNWR